MIATVIGCWSTGERFRAAYDTQGGPARAAEDQAQEDATAEGGGSLWVARLVPGDVPGADTYTRYVDPADRRNDDEEGLEPDLADVTRTDPPWTVIGIAVPAGTRLDDPAVVTLGERYLLAVRIASPLAAEDVARAGIREQGGDLWVCGTLDGEHQAADLYATHVGPDVRAVQPSQRDRIAWRHPRLFGHHR